VIFPVVLSVTEGDVATVAVTLAYPLADCVTLAFVVLAFTVLGWKPGRQWLLLGLGFVAPAIADSVYTYQASVSVFDDQAVINALWPLGTLLVSAAAWVNPSRARVLDNGWRSATLTLAFAAVALGLLAYGQFVALTPTAGLMGVGALVAVVLRAALTLRENSRIINTSERRAVTDALSGLHNRRQLMSDLAAMFVDGRPGTLAFFDLDGFKAYNDTFGHAAGDALLARLGGELKRVVSDHGRAYRLGGDEFCVLLDAAVTRQDPLIVAAAAAFRQRGEHFTIEASYGIVAIPHEADTPESALRLADERMYEDKHSSRASGGAQVMDVLLAALHEREPNLQAHHGHVSRLATDVARELGCESETVDETARAAALHDIGKVAIPDAILRKPGPLNDEEWAYMRQHTIIGERILMAAPALRPVALIIRSTHERYDGHGYPDSLAGDRIPLAARIVAVCDAYDAMSVQRPYNKPLTSGAALSELRACSGTQFDPAVVAAFDRVIRRGRAVTRDPSPAGGVGGVGRVGDLPALAVRS
jgi:two-component system cell cycle response regulator